jgi:hypothetical protein
MFNRRLTRSLAVTAAAAVVALGVIAGTASASTPRITLQNLATGFMLDSGPGGDVYTLPANGGAYQKWYANPSTYGTRVFSNAATGRCLDSNADGAVYTSYCNGGSFQKWIVVHNDDGTVILRDLATGLVLDSGPGGDVYTLPSNGGSYQRWRAANA